jgi:hypothetical protein
VGDCVIGMTAIELLQRASTKLNVLITEAPHSHQDRAQSACFDSRAVALVRRVGWSRYLPTLKVLAASIRKGSKRRHRCFVTSAYAKLMVTTLAYIMVC